MVVHRKKDGIEAALDAAGVREKPVRVLNEVLLPAMKEVGDKFGAGELILPFVLQSAEVMKKAVKHLEQFLERAEGYTKGKVVLATVYGDVHDIGKSLVNTILSNNGYTVFDLGKQVPVNTIIDKALEVGADAIGLSALLVSTSKQMPLCVQELDRRGMKIPVLIGGAAINRRFGRRALFVEGERAYDAGRVLLQGRVRGAGDDGRLQDDDARDAVHRRSCIDDARNDMFLHTNVGKDIAVGIERRRSAATSRADNPVPRAPFFGTRTLHGHPARRSVRAARPRRAVSPAVGRARIGPEYEQTVTQGVRADARASQGSREARTAGSSRRRSTATSPCSRRATTSSSTIPTRTRADGTTARDRALPFPAAGRPRASVYRRLLPLDAIERRRRRGVPDRDRRRRRDASGSRSCRPPASTPKRSTSTASRSRRPKRSPSGCIARSRHELGVPAGQGKRYSWGYGACPDLEDHAQLFKLLPAERELGMELTSAFQLIPEQSTAAIM